MTQRPSLPSAEAIQALLAEIEPGSRFITTHPIAKDHANVAVIVEARSASGASFRLVIKCYIDYGDDQHSHHAQREFQALTMLQAHQVPAPKPLLVDVAGTRLGSPMLVTQYVSGEEIWTATDWEPYVYELAMMLAKLHSISVDDAAKQFLFDGNQEAVWFMKRGTMPDYMQRHPDGPLVWQAVRDLLLERQPIEPVLVHLDYWMGNVLWHQGRIVAVMDWEEASYGDPAVDVGYCRMDMFLSGMGPQAADKLLDIYEVEMGRPTSNLSLWEFAAAPRPMQNPEWEADCRQELRDFIATAKRKAGY